ncbi:MAG TPA: 50S ribosomal protein L3 [Anaerolineae bacterium]|nr:50S ribosomal protein L3 [Anaerolineae bacterium]
MKGILGKKVGMTQIFTERGERVPVTVIEAGPCYVIQVRTVKKNGYQAIQLGFNPVKRAERLSQGERGHLGLLKTDEKHPQRKKLPAEVPPVRTLREFHISEDEQYTEGQEIKVDIFQVGDRVDVIGASKGKGFAGNMKRHGFSGGPRTHGQSDRGRAPGSIGAGTTPGKIIKGKKMAGHMGQDRVTSQHLDVVLIDSERNLIGVRGSVPGANGDLVLVQEVRKR